MYMTIKRNWKHQDRKYGNKRFFT